MQTIAVRLCPCFFTPAGLGGLGLADGRPVTADPARRTENRCVEIVVDTDAITARSVTR